MRRLFVVGLALLLSIAPATADYLHVQRPAIARDAPDGDADELRRLEPGVEVALQSTTQQNGYYKIRLPEGGDAWVYRTLVRRYPGALPGASDGGNAADDASSTPTATAGALDASAFLPTDCPPEGTAQRKALQDLNRLKNRAIGPAPGIVMPIDLDDLIFPGDDRENWKSSQAIEVVGFVFEVKKGGIETCNCGATEEIDRDTHIEIVRDPDNTTASERIIIEVTPTWRRFMAQTRNVDWSTATLKAQIKGKWIKVRGWMMFDAQHTGNAVNANPSGSLLWRATAWEIHPITELAVVPAPVQ